MKTVPVAQLQTAQDHGPIEPRGEVSSGSAAPTPKVPFSPPRAEEPDHRAFQREGLHRDGLPGISKRL